MHTKGRINPFINRQPLKSVSREEFLARIRKSLGHEGDVPPAPGEPPALEESLIRQVAKNDPGMVDRWIAKAKGTGVKVTRVPADASAITSVIGTAFAEHKIGRVVMNAGEPGERFGISQWLAGKGISEMRWGTPNSMELAFQCDASITDVRAGLADTGSFLVWSDPGFGRSSTLVVPVHVVLLPVSRILPDMIDGFELLMRETGEKIPSNVVTINGPSKTSDIEMKLVTGVHGPKYLYAVVIDGM